MRVLKKEIVGRNGEGSIQVQADEAEDMYHLFNLICEGDMVVATTIRNVVKESNTGSTSKTRQRMTLKIKVEKIEFDAEKCALRLNGRNVEENEFVKMGQYHTIDLETGRPFKIEKVCWDSIFLERLGEACDPSKKAELAALVMQEGLAHLCLVTSSMTLTRAKIEKRIPKKAQGNGAYDKSRLKFFEEVYDAVKKHINFDVVKVIIVGSPGFLKDDFMKFMMESAVRQGDQVIIKQKSKFLKAHASSGYKRAIDELLGNAELRSQLADVKAADEVRALQEFYDLLSADPDRACYGYNEVVYADEQLAIDELLVTDNLFKAADFHKRKQYVALVERVKEHGGKVFIFSSMHVSGEQLDQYTGVAATLRFPLADIDLQIAEAANTRAKISSAVNSSAATSVTAASVSLSGGGSKAGGGRRRGASSNYIDNESSEDDLLTSSEDEEEEAEARGKTSKAGEKQFRETRDSIADMGLES